MALLDEHVSDVAHAAADPQKRRLGIAARGVRNERAQIVEELGVLDNLRRAAAARPTSARGGSPFELGVLQRPAVFGSPEPEAVLLASSLSASAPGPSAVTDASLYCPYESGNLTVVVWPGAKAGVSTSWSNAPGWLLSNRVELAGASPPPAFCTSAMMSHWSAAAQRRRPS